jgi:hypothetical protein
MSNRETKFPAKTLYDFVQFRAAISCWGATEDNEVRTIVMERDEHRNFHDLPGNEKTRSETVAPSGYLCFCTESRAKIELII